MSVLGAGRPSGELLTAAEAVFGDRMALAVRYRDLLATDGTVRGLIGPREVPRLWERHLLNCAVVADAIPLGAHVVDVGSGAGLPGIPLALARPDVSVTLVEPLARRVDFLTEVVAALGLDRVDVVRARAEECPRGSRSDWWPQPQWERWVAVDVVVARAVAPLGRLVGWCLPLVMIGGRVLAIKGETAVDEARQHTDEIIRLGGSRPVVRRCGIGIPTSPTTVVEIVRERPAAASRLPGRLPGFTAFG